MMTNTFTFDNQQLMQCFPFHLLIDENLNTQSVGVGLANLIAIKPGDQIANHFKLIAPFEKNISTETLCNLHQQTIILAGTAAPYHRFSGILHFNKSHHNFLFAGDAVQAGVKENNNNLALAYGEQQVKFALEKIGDNVWEHNFTTGVTIFTKEDLFLPELSQNTNSDNASIWWNAIHKSDLPLLERNDHKYRHGLIDHHSLEYRMLMRDGSVKWILDRGVVIEKHRNGMPQKIIGTHTDITSIKQTAEALAKSQQRWEFAIEGSGACVWEYNFEKNKGTYSMNYAQLLGYNVQEPGTDYDWVQTVHPDDKQILKQNYQKYLADQQTQHSITYRLKCNDGSFKWILDRGMIIEKLPDGRPFVCIGTHTDITHIKHTQHELETTAKRLSSLIGNLNSGILVEDETQRTVLANQVYCNLFNIADSPENLADKDCSKRVEQLKHRFKNPEVFVTRVAEILSKKERVITEELELVNGRFVERDFIPVFQQGKYLGHLWLYTDITERKRADKILRRSEEKYRMLIANMHLGLIELDINQNIVQVNQSFCNISGYHYEELIGKKATSILIPPEKAELIKEKMNNRKIGISEAYETEVIDKSGQLKWWLVSAGPVYNEMGECNGSIGIHLDITQQKLLEQQLRIAKLDAEQSSVAKDVFLANMSHEIRTPMNAILGLSRQLEKTILTTQQHNYLHSITTASDNLLVIINDILDFSKIESGKLALEKIGFRLRDIVKHCNEVTDHRVKEKDLYFKICIAEPIEDVLIGDPYRLNQVLLNLLSNAIKFTDSGGVTLRCSMVDKPDNVQLITIAISDSGIGMTAAFVKDIFNKFSQEEKSVSRRYGGTGLGMSISKQLVELMGGHIKVESEKGQATTIFITIPFKKGAINDLPVKDTTCVDNSILRGRRILLAEDNEMNRLVATTILEQYGLIVENAENGKIAIEMLENSSYDLILMDIRMPEMDGLEATRIIRNRINKNIPIIALTANVLKTEQENCMQAGMNEFVAKPFEEKDLIRIIARCLGDEVVTDINNNVAVVVDKQALYSLDEIKNMSRGDLPFVHKIAEIFINESVNAVKLMNAALEAGDYNKISEVAHRIKPSIKNMAIHSITDDILALENFEATPDNTDRLPTLISNVDEVLGKVVNEMKVEIGYR